MPQDLNVKLEYKHPLWGVKFSVIKFIDLVQQDLNVKLEKYKHPPWGVKLSQV